MDVLIVDDSSVMRKIVQRGLREAGFRNLSIGEASNGAEALLQLAKATPRVILSDWNMPEMSGIDLLKRVRGTNSKVPFGFITSEASSEIKELSKSSGANFLIVKPFTPEDVQDALSPILG